MHARPATLSPWITVAEAASRLGVSPETVRSWIASGVIDAYRYGGVTRVEAASVQRFTELHRVRVAGSPAATATSRPRRGRIVR